MDNYNSVDQLAERFGVGRKVIYRLIHDGDLRAVQVGKKLFRVPETEVQRWLTAQLQGGGQSG